MVTQKYLDTLKWWYETQRISEEYVESLVTSGKITQADADHIMGV